MVGHGQHVRARLDQDLSPGQLGGLFGEIGVADRAFRFLQVGLRLVQADHVAVQRRCLERTQSAAKSRDLVDDFVDHFGGTADVIGQTLRLTAGQFVQSTAGTTELTGADAADAQAGSLRAGDFRSQLERRTATGDVKADVAADAFFDRHGQVQRAGVDRQSVAGCVGRDSVDRCRQVGTGGTFGGQAALERSAFAFADDFDIDQRIRTVRGAGQLQRTAVVFGLNAGRVGNQVDRLDHVVQRSSLIELEDFGPQRTGQLNHQVGVQSAAEHTAGQVGRGRRGVVVDVIAAVTIGRGDFGTEAVQIIDGGGDRSDIDRTIAADRDHDVAVVVQRCLSFTGGQRVVRVQCDGNAIAIGTGFIRRDRDHVVGCRVGTTGQAGVVRTQIRRGEQGRAVLHVLGDERAFVVDRGGNVGRRRTIGHRDVDHVVVGVVNRFGRVTAGQVQRHAVTRGAVGVTTVDRFDVERRCQRRVGAAGQLSRQRAADRRVVGRVVGVVAVDRVRCDEIVTDVIVDRRGDVGDRVTVGNRDRQQVVVGVVGRTGRRTTGQHDVRVVPLGTVGRTTVDRRQVKARRAAGRVRTAGQLAGVRARIARGDRTRGTTVGCNGEVRVAGQVRHDCRGVVAFDQGQRQRVAVGVIAGRRIAADLRDDFDDRAVTLQTIGQAAVDRIDVQRHAAAQRQRTARFGIGRERIVEVDRPGRFGANGVGIAEGRGAGCFGIGRRCTEADRPGGVGCRGRCGDPGGRDRRLGGSGLNFDVHADLAKVAQVGLVNFQVFHVGKACAGLGVEIQAAVQQFSALESGRLGDPIDRFQRTVDLQLIRLDFLGRQGTAVGCFDDQAADVVQQAADLAQGTVSGADDLAGSLRVADRLVQSGDFSPQGFAGDQTGRIVRTRVDTQTGRQTRQASLQVGVAGLKSVLGDKRRNVGVDPCHGDFPYAAASLPAECAFRRSNKFNRAAVRSNLGRHRTPIHLPEGSNTFLPSAANVGHGEILANF